MAYAPSTPIPGTLCVVKHIDGHWSQAEVLQWKGKYAVLSGVDYLVPFEFISPIVKVKSGPELIVGSVCYGKYRDGNWYLLVVEEISKITFKVSWMGFDDHTIETQDNVMPFYQAIISLPLYGKCLARRHNEDGKLNWDVGTLIHKNANGDCQLEAGSEIWICSAGELVLPLQDSSLSYLEKDIEINSRLFGSITSNGFNLDYLRRSTFCRIPNPSYDDDSPTFKVLLCGYSDNVNYAIELIENYVEWEDKQLKDIAVSGRCNLLKVILDELAPIHTNIKRIYWDVPKGSNQKKPIIGVTLDADLSGLKMKWKRIQQDSVCPYDSVTKKTRNVDPSNSKISLCLVEELIGCTMLSFDRHRSDNKDYIYINCMDQSSNIKNYIVSLQTHYITTKYEHGTQIDSLINGYIESNDLHLICKSGSNISKEREPRRSFDRVTQDFNWILDVYSHVVDERRKYHFPSVKSNVIIDAKWVKEPPSLQITMARANMLAYEFMFKHMKLPNVLVQLVLSYLNPMEIIIREPYLLRKCDDCKLCACDKCVQLYKYEVPDGYVFGPTFI